MELILKTTGEVRDWWRKFEEELLKEIEYKIKSFGINQEMHAESIENLKTEIIEESNNEYHAALEMFIEEHSWKMDVKILRNLFLKRYEEWNATVNQNINLMLHLQEA